MIRDAWLVCRKELRIEARSRVTLSHVLPFVLAVTMLFAFALDAESTILRRATPGLFWVTVLFAATMITQRMAAIDRLDGLGDALRMSGLSPAGMFLGKTAALTVQLVATEVTLAVAMVVMYDVRLRGIALIAVATPVATIAIAIKL